MDFLGCLIWVPATATAGREGGPFTPYLSSLVAGPVDANEPIKSRHNNLVQVASTYKYNIITW